MQKKQAAENAKKGGPPNKFDEMMKAAKSHVGFAEKIANKKKLKGIPKNMFKGISHEMMQNIVEGKSPVCAIQKRINNGKMMAFNIGKAFGLIPSKANVKGYMSDKNKFWAQQFLS